jgi:hypothetical protein
MNVAEHNGAQWYEIAWVETPPPWHREIFTPGWHVVRICRCHSNQPVTIYGQATRAAAELILRDILSVNP